jgi:hypothetical protein
MSTITTTMQNVTPEQAQQWLAHNTHNRNLRESQVAALANDITNGNWNWNGDSIKFADDGTLLDGQHRLHAIIRAGQPIEMLIIHGLDKDTQVTMDTGAKRTGGDALKLQGEKYYTTLAAGLRACILWDSGVRNLGGGNRVTTNSTLLDYLENHPEMRDYVEAYTQLRRGIEIPASVGVTAIKILSEIDPDDADYFFSRLGSDEGHYKGEPIYELRRALLDNAAATSKTRGGRTTTWKLAIIIKAWNKYRNGETIKQLSYRPGGANREKFPEPI